MSKKILIVEDEKDIAILIEDRLKASGYETVIANDGLEGLKKAREEMPRLVILDVMMPKMDGFNVCRMLKYDKKFQDTPIIMLTARDQDIDKKSGGEVRADAYLTKPYDPKELMNKIKELIGEA